MVEQWRRGFIPAPAERGHSGTAPAGRGPAKLGARLRRRDPVFAPTSFSIKKVIPAGGREGGAPVPTADPDQIPGTLIPCAKCGQAVADYRGTCPFCGEPTGRPDRPRPEASPPGAAAARDKKRWSWRSLVVPLILVACVLAFAGCVALINRSNSKTQPMSSGATAFVHKAMPALDQVLAEAQAGNDTQAAHDWNAIGDMPALTPVDLAVAEKYTAYADGVRSYLLGDGSATLQQVEAAKAATQAAITKAAQAN